jgi:hypothetical protein
VITGNAAQTSSEMPAKISGLRPVASMARATAGSSKAFTDERSMMCASGNVSTSSGKVGPHILSRAVSNRPAFRPGTRLPHSVSTIVAIFRPMTFRTARIGSHQITGFVEIGVWPVAKESNRQAFVVAFHIQAFG